MSVYRGGHRSSRLVYTARINSVMNKNTMHFTIGAHGIPVETTVGSALYTITASASAYAEDFEPYKAFTQNPGLDGWLTSIGELKGSWIEVNLPKWYRRPGNPAPESRRGVNPPPITEVKVWNPSNPTKTPKEFVIQALDGNEWIDLKTCKIKKNDANYKSVFYIRYKDEEGEEIMDWEDVPSYMDFRLLITEVYGEEQVGFSHIEFCGPMDHRELTWQQFNWYDYEYEPVRREPRFYEKFFIQNDYNDGIIWEKLHQTDFIMIPHISWYPGHYSANSTRNPIIHPNLDDPSKPPYVNMVTDNIIQDRNESIKICRSGDFAVRINVSSVSTQGIQVTKDGLHWKRMQRTSGLPLQHLSFRQGSNNGVSMSYDSTKLYTVEINEHTGEVVFNDPMTVPNPGYNLYTGTSGFLISSSWTYKIEGLDYFYGYDELGARYNTRIPKNYTYDDRGTVKQGTYSWTFKTIGTTSIAYAFWPYQRTQDQTFARLILLVSNDGFANFSQYYITNNPENYPNGPIIGYNRDAFYSVNFGYYGGDFYFIERGVNLNDGLRLYKFGSSYGNNPIISGLGDTRVPIIGRYTDPSYRDVIATDHPSGSGEYSTFDAELKLDTNILDYANDQNCLYFIEGRVADAQDYIILPRPFKKTNWSDNSWLEGGIVMIKAKDLLNMSSSGSFAFGTTNYMIDPDNETYKHIFDPSLRP